MYRTVDIPGFYTKDDSCIDQKRDCQKLFNVRISIRKNQEKFYIFTFIVINIPHLCLNN